MFNNVALDVVIGLTLVFLLYGLLVTILSEMAASWLGFRQRMLRLCIERMLNDNYYDHGAGTWARSWNNVKRFFLFEFDDFHFSVAGRFYREPTIKYLAKGEKATALSFANSKPSYIDPDTFALTVIHLMRDKGLGETDLEKTQYCLTFNTLHFQRETIRAITAMFRDSGPDLNIFGDNLKAWFLESMARNTGWYKRMMRVVSFFLGLALAIVFNIDSIKIAKLLSRDKEARGQLVNLAIGVSKDTLLANNFGNSSAPQRPTTAIVDSSLAHVSQDISLANYVLGLGWGFDRLGNEVSDTVSGKTNRNGYTTLVRLRDAADSIESWRYSIRSIELKHRALLRYILLQQTLKIPPNKIAGKDSLVRLTDSMNKYTLLVEMDSLRSDSVLANRVNVITGNDYFVIRSIRQAGLPADSVIVIHGLTPYGFWHKVGYCLHGVFGTSWLVFLGLLLTAIALSLGAPFWFDMLAKIVAIRGSGIPPPTPKPTEVIVSTGPALINILPAAAPAGPIAQANPITIAVRNCRAALNGVAGILSIDEGLRGPRGAMVDVIEIHVLDSNCATRVTTALGASYQNFPLNILVTAGVKAHLRSGNTIMNAVVNKQPPPTMNNGLGTLGCFVKKDGSAAQYLISCWHVVKGDWDWASHGGPDTITDGNGKKIGRVVDGCLSTDMDIGFVQLDSTGNTNNFTKKWRPVIKDDVNQQMTVQFIGATSGSVTDPLTAPIIFNHSVSITGGLEYPDGIRRVLTDMFSITRVADGTPTPASDHGDSGALVLDANNVPLGILVGGDEMFTYVAKFSNILAADRIYKEYSLLI